ncbi:hypothetical protein Tco_0313088 [Tanacetum coccineum]
MKQHQNEVNEIHAERIARNANPLAFIAATQNYPDDYYKVPPAPKPYKPHTPSSRQTTSTRSNATTKHKGKEILKSHSPQSESASEKDRKDNQNAEEHDNERVLLANLKLDVDENKKIQKQLNKANTSLTQELDKYKLDLKYCKIELERNKTFQTNQKDKKEAEIKFKEALDLLACNTYKNAKCLKTEAYRTFANPEYLKKSQWGKPYLYNVQYDKNDLANMFAPESEETIRLAEKSITKLEKTNKSISKSKYAFQDVQANVDNIKSIVETDWQQHKIGWQNPITHDIKLLIHDMFIALAHKTLKNVGIFENALKEEMLEDLKYVKSVEKEFDDLKMEINDLKSQLEHEKIDFPKFDDLLLQKNFSRDFVCVIFLSLDDIDEYSKMACKYLEKN